MPEIIDSQKCVLFGKARFQLMTPRILRMEWAEDTHFEDSPTFTCMNRKLSCPDFGVKTGPRRITLSAPHFTLEYTDDGRSFHRNNLAIRFNHKGKSAKWHPDKKDTGNLGGTLPTLDMVAGKRAKLQNGLISKSGWSLVDDSNLAVLDMDEDGRYWPRERTEGKRQDLYFIYCGLDFIETIREAAKVFGDQPLIPRYALGYWWSRYWAYTDTELEELVRQFNERAIPLDVLVIDMDWHLQGWTGYTFDPAYFPDPADFFKWLKSQDIKITLNLHPADGVLVHEEKFREFAEALGTRPEDGTIPFQPVKKEYIKTYFELLHHPHEEIGVDFWWMDWQQGEKTGIKGLRPLPWLNYLHWEDMRTRREGERPMIFSRYGGVGFGKYPVGFSGDTFSLWDSLAFQPEFTATAANVLFGYWSHDIGGHMGGNLDPELYTRWIQFGVFSPILRTHTNKNPISERRIFAYPEPWAERMRNAFLLRYEMVPYIYGELKAMEGSGLSLCLPCYYHHPEDEKAYQFPNQYYFGSKMIVAPIVQPADNTLKTTEHRFWLPSGEWFDLSTGEKIQGDKVHTRRYLGEEIPRFVRCGTVIPFQSDCMRLREGSYEKIGFSFYPGASAEGTLYEDDGITTGHLDGGFSLLKAEYQEGETRRTITLHPSEGSFNGFEPLREVELRLPVAVPPREILFDKKKLKWNRHIGEQAKGWSYSGEKVCTIIRLGRIDLRKEHVLVLEDDASFRREDAFGLEGCLRRLREATSLTGAHISWEASWDQDARAHRDRVAIAQTGSMLSRTPGEWDRLIAGLHANSADLAERIDAMWNHTKSNEMYKALQFAVPLTKEAYQLLDFS